ncbi:hypothetical protein GDO86_010356 [Hymenochirus boettgeri]|uniref:Uncharacterized protein n=1 Tax=Hymenochirus boettgeri TaxID=247094 RepID=A0A8T2JSP5_9PIPI|nr:hypothetical protein GDO86_010356 [Hymenochirus boettgeri]
MPGVNEESEAKKIFPTSHHLTMFTFPPPENGGHIYWHSTIAMYKKVDPKREPYWTHVSADGCRLALIGNTVESIWILTSFNAPHSQM